jgi:hypothetical protein
MSAFERALRPKPSVGSLSVRTQTVFQRLTSGAGTRRIHRNTCPEFVSRRRAALSGGGAVAGDQGAEIERIVINDEIQFDGTQFHRDIAAKAMTGSSKNQLVLVFTFSAAKSSCALSFCPNASKHWPRCWCAISMFESRQRTSV